MSFSTFLGVFASGLLAGMLILVFAWRISSGEHLGFLGGIGRLFLRFRRVRKQEETRPSTADISADVPSSVDRREQNLYDSAQIIRKILVILAASIQQTDKAASASSLVLDDVKNAMSTGKLPTDIREAQALLLKEIDCVLLSNTALKGELAKSQVVLTEQQRQIDDLRTAVRIDSLTKLANRAYFDEKLHEMIALRRRYGEPFCLMMIDLDNFKGINDTHGHPVGDRILKGVAQKLKASLRGSDFLARFGGDEFALILLKTDGTAATEVAWKLCEQVRGSRFLLDDAAVTMTLSIGVAEASGNDSEATLLQRADAALYRAKSAGRNGVSVDAPAVGTAAQD